MAVATESAGLGMTATGVISPVLWKAGVRVEAIVTLMAFQPNFWKIWELTDPFTQGKGAFTNYVYKIWLFLTTYPPPFTFSMV